MESSIKRRKPLGKVLLVILVGTGITTGAAGISLHLLQAQHSRRALPAEVPVTWMVHHGSGGFLSECGAAIFAMSPEDSRRIARTGMARRALAYPPSSMSSDPPVALGGWKTTPIPESWTEGTWPALGCSGTSRIAEFTTAAKTEGSFYALLPNGWVLVIPSLNRVIYSYEG